MSASLFIIIVQLLFEYIYQSVYLIALAIAQIILFTLSICCDKIYFLVHFEVNIYHPYAAALASMFKCKSHLAYTARASHDSANFGIFKQLLL